MTLDGYRHQTVERLKACRASGTAREILAEVDLMLTNCQISSHAQKRFWEALNSDLEVVAQECTRPLGKQAADALSVISVAQAWIAQKPSPTH